MKIVFYLMITILFANLGLKANEATDINETDPQRLKILSVVPCDGGHLSFMAGIINALNQKGHSIVTIVTSECSQKRLDSTNLTHSAKKILIKNWFNMDINIEPGIIQFIFTFEKIMTSQNKELREGLRDYFNNEGKEEKFDLIISDSVMIGALLEAEVQGIPTVVNHPIVAPVEYLSDRGLHVFKEDASLLWYCLTISSQLIFRNFMTWIEQTMLEENLAGVELMTREHLFEYSFRFPAIIAGSTLLGPAAGSELRHVYIGANRNIENYPSLLQHIKEWIYADSKDIIYISFGTHTLFTEKELQKFVGLLEEQKSKYRYIWGVTNSIKEILDSLMIERHTIFYEVYLPQVALLNEKAVKIFITHGGITSLFDALMAETPVICIPAFADQPFNCKNFEMHQMGIQLTSAAEFNKIFMAIDEITEHREVYGKHIKLMKKSFEDTGEYDALEEFIVEVVREKWLAQPASFPTQSLNFYIAYYFVVGVIVGVVFGVPLIVLGIIYCCCCKRKKTKQE